jgi:hypothetical protein
MSVRALSALVLVASVVAAACGSSSKATPTATPVPSQTSTPMPTAVPTQVIARFTPVEEVLTPPPDIDTSGWLTYRDDANGFELKYPPDLVLERNVTSPTESGVTGTRFTFPVPPGNELQSKIGFISVQSKPGAECMPREARLTLLHAPHGDFWSFRGLNGAGPNQFRSMYYAVSRGPSCVTLEGLVTLLDPRAFRTPPPTYDRDSEADAFLAMISTFRWLN